MGENAGDVLRRNRAKPLRAEIDRTIMRRRRPGVGRGGYLRQLYEERQELGVLDSPGAREEGRGNRAFSPRRVHAIGGAMERSLSRHPSAGRRIVVNQPVTQVAVGPVPLDRISPMQHGFEAALFLDDRLPAVLSYLG
jgi:hypothetical protein